MNILDKIVDHKRLELEHKKRQRSQQDHVLKAQDTAPAQAFLSRFEKDKTNIIAEIKKASPSAGLIREGFDPVEIAKIYEDHGASAISVLTDEHFFRGHLNSLTEVKKAVDLPLLRKDFTINEYDIFEGRAHGADAILLIVAILDDHQLKDYHDLICELGMTPLVEAHDQAETERAMAINPPLLGINNRNLKTFKVDPQTSIELMTRNQLQMPVISESGITSREVILELERANIAGFLVGETLMRSLNIGEKLKYMLTSPPL